MAELALIESIREALTMEDVPRLKHAAFDIGMEVIDNSNHLPDQFFDALLALFDWPVFLRAEGSSHIVFALYMNWDELSETQRDGVLRVLERTYPLFTDRTSSFYITVILGERAANAQALDILCRLKHVDGEVARALVPHGLEHLATDVPDPGIAKRAYAELLSMRDDASRKVRCEVTEALAHVAARVAATPTHALAAIVPRDAGGGG